MSDHVAKAMRRLVAVYGEPKTEFGEDLFDEFNAALSGFRGDVLTKGVDRIVRDRAYQNWPTVGEVVKACRDIADEMADKHVPSGQFENRKYEPVDQKIAERLLTAAMKGLDPRNSFPAIQARADAWHRQTGVPCCIKVSEPWGQEVKDIHGRIVPIGWRMGDAT